MSSPIAMPLEAQASALVSFLAQAQQTLATSAALEICGGMRAAKLPPARFLKAALAEQNIELKHTSCLKAVALMDGFAGHVSRPKPTWLVARYIFEAPAITPKVKSHPKGADATADLCTRLADDLSDTKERPYGFVFRGSDYIEFLFEGEPQPDARYILSCKGPGDSPAVLEESDTLNAIERVRRVVEGQFNGWLDGAAKIAQPRTGRLRLLKDGVVVAEGMESAILAACEADDDFDLQSTSLLRLPADSRRYRVLHVIAGSDQHVPVEDEILERLWRRLEAFYRFNETDFSWFLGRRQEEHKDGRFVSDGFDEERLSYELQSRAISPGEAAALAGVTSEEWQAAMERGELLRTSLFSLTRGLGLSSANDLYVDSRAPVWMPVSGGEEIALWMRNFDHLRLTVSGVAKGAPLAERSLEKLMKLYRRAPDPISLQAVLTEAEAAGLRLCATIEKRFVSDLPIARERLAMVGHLSLWDGKEIESLGPPKTSIDDDNEAGEWTTIDEEYLVRFNSASVTVDDLIALQEEVTRARHEGQEPGWETATFAAARVFKGRAGAAHLAHTAITRMTAMSHLIQTGALAAWMEKSNEADVELVPKNVLKAAARCPLVRVRNEAGFDAATFRHLALEYSAGN